MVENLRMSLSMGFENIESSPGDQRQNSSSAPSNTPNNEFFDVQKCLDENAKLLDDWTKLLDKHGRKALTELFSMITQIFRSRRLRICSARGIAEAFYSGKPR